ncbi:hypothetical protein ACWDKQ_01905 [Saccharopolyspora sp. NPDC000995]
MACRIQNRSSGSEETSSAPTSVASGSGFAGFDPCTFCKPDELTSFGVSTQSEDGTVVSFEPGCKWKGEKMTLSLLKNSDETVASYEKGGSWDSYQKKPLDGRRRQLRLSQVPPGKAGAQCLLMQLAALPSI